MNGTATDGLSSAAAHTSVDSVDFAVLGSHIPSTDADAAGVARDRLGAEFGRLAEVAGWLAATQHHAPPLPSHRPRCVVIGEPVDDAEPTVASIADSLGVGVRRIAAPSAVADAARAGMEAADAEVDGGADLVLLVAPASPGDAAAAALVSVLGALEPVALLPRGTAALDSAAWSRRAVRVRDTRRAAMPFRSRPDALLAALGSPTLAAACGFVMRATGRRTPLVLDGAAALAAALLVYDIAPLAVDWWQAADTSPDPAHARACEELGLNPLLALGITSADGTAGLLTLPMLRAAVAAGPAPSRPAAASP